LHRTQKPERSSVLVRGVERNPTETNIPAPESSRLSSSLAAPSVGARHVEPLQHSAAAELIYTFFAVFGTGAGTVYALYLAARDGLSPFYLGLLIAFDLITAFGVTAGLHRLFSHRSYKSTRWMAVLLSIAGTASGQGFFFRWIYEHRVHHRTTDQPGDPHSPYYCGERRLGMVEGLLHSHVLWLFRPRQDIERKIVLDLADDPVWIAIDRWSPVITVVGVLLAGLFGYLYERSAHGFLLGVLWGGFVRMFVIYQVTWSVNSIGHSFGTRIAAKGHKATNNALLGWIALGDGWHANHHDDPSAARHGGPGQSDTTYLLLCAAKRCGWVWDMRMPKGI
jgi:stearoyl-CoA desaturase (Delta-9 desaturase)